MSVVDQSLVRRDMLAVAVSKFIGECVHIIIPHQTVVWHRRLRLCGRKGSSDTTTRTWVALSVECCVGPNLPVGLLGGPTEILGDPCLPPFSAFAD
jgi:hypothetical protein